MVYALYWICSVIGEKQAAEQVMLQEVQKRARKADNVYIVNFLMRFSSLQKHSSSGFNHVTVYFGCSLLSGPRKWLPNKDGNFVLLFVCPPFTLKAVRWLAKKCVVLSSRWTKELKCITITYLPANNQIFTWFCRNAWMIFHMVDAICFLLVAKTLAV